MILKVGNEYINQRISVAIERKSKLFEAIGESQGDYSYSFALDDTADTRKKLGITSINQTNKRIYRRVTASLLSDAGTEIYFGFIKIESIVDGINCSFFSGNSNWMDELNVPLRDMDFSVFDKDVTAGAILSSWTQTSGIVFPMVDKGPLSTRSSAFLRQDDFHPFIFVKDIFSVISTNTGIKIGGDLLTDSRFSMLITSNNGLAGLQKRIAERTVYIGKAGTQATSGSLQKVTFTNESAPYSDSDFGNWNEAQSHYVADIDLKKVKIEVNIVVDSAHHSEVAIIKNGSETLFSDIQNPAVSVTSFTFEASSINGGDTIEVQYRALFTNRTIQPSSWIKITPVKFEKAFVDSMVPDVSASEFVSDIFRVLNIVPSYDPYSKTINTIKFKSIYNRTPINLSEFVHSYSTDYIDVVSSYARQNNLKYSQQSLDEITEYNEANNVQYGGGAIRIDNDFLEDEDDLFELGFVAPYQRFINAVGTSLPSVDFAETQDEGQSRSITSVTDDGSGNAQFNWSSGGAMTGVTTNFTLFRISDSSNNVYNGEFIAQTINAGSVIFYDMPFDSTATATLTVIDIVDKDNDDQVLLLFQTRIDLSEFSGRSELFFLTPTDDQFAFAYFYFPDIGVPFNNGPKKQALYFDPINDPGAYQRGIKEDEYNEMQRILNDPVKATCEMYLPEAVFNRLDFLSPVRVTTKDFDSVFFVNLITAYEGSHLPCTVELIKLD